MFDGRLYAIAFWLTVTRQIQKHANGDSHNGSNLWVHLLILMLRFRF
jgi:hypothetical protein